MSDESDRIADSVSRDWAGKKLNEIQVVETQNGNGTIDLKGKSFFAGLGGGEGPLGKVLTMAELEDAAKIIQRNLKIPSRAILRKTQKQK